MNFATNSARVQLETAKPADLAAALEEAHYPARSEDVALIVEGLSCASCVRRSEQTLEQMPGVMSASVNLANGTARVHVLTGTTTPSELARALTDIGYPAKPADDSTDTPMDRAAEEEAKALRAALIAGSLTLPVFVMEMGGHLVPAFHHLLYGAVDYRILWAIQYLLTTLVLVWPGQKFFTVGIPALLKGAPEMNSLVALGSFAAWAYSSVVLFLPWLLPEDARAVYFEAAAVIVTLILVGRWLEARAKGRAGTAIQALIGLQPKTARVERDGAISELPLEDIVLGDLVHIRPGEKVAVDGEVVSGHSYVDEAMITGEAKPVNKSTGDNLIGGTINGQGSLVFRATGIGRDTVLARIIDMVEQAQAAKLPVQALADRVVGIFVPAVLAVAVLTVAIWLVLGPEPTLSRALVAGVSVLIIACPCAMGLATPTSIMVGTGRAAELGVFFRQGVALQRLEGAQLVAFDKTGTLTEGHLSLTNLTVADGVDRDDMLAQVAAVEAQSEHPVARAIEAAADGLTLPEVAEFSARPGYGVTAQVAGQALWVGSRRMLSEGGVDLTALEARMVDGPGSRIYVARDGHAVAAMTFADAPKASSQPVIAALHEMGLKTAMISGDGQSTVEAVAAQLGIDDVAAEILPDGKAEALDRLRETHGPVVFVGDGINDAPALAQADVGIAVGTGTDVSIETADVVLMSGDLNGVLTALRLARATMRNIRQNLFWAFAYNIALIPVAAGLLYPMLGVMLSPMLAAAAMALSSVFVISNALRLRFVS